MDDKKKKVIRSVRDSIVKAAAEVGVVKGKSDRIE